MTAAAAFRRALAISWVIVAFALMAAVFAPFVASEDTISGLFPACEARLRGQPCVLCGMTTAYIRLAHFDIPGALEANRYSLALWTATVVNFSAAKAYILFRLVRSARRRN